MTAFLAIDIGNSTIHAGLFSDPQSTPLSQTRIRPENLSTELPAWLNNKTAIDRAAIASVNPHHFSALLDQWPPTLPTPTRIPNDIPVPIENKTKTPEQVGIDRLLNAYAAYAITGVASIVIDFGTALTLDVIDMEGSYLGGVIAPGLQTSIQALSQTASAIEAIELKSQAHVLGRTTFEAVTSGYYHGYQGMIRYLIEQLDAECNLRHEILFTGGNAELIASAMGWQNKIVPTLTLNAIVMVASAHD